MILVFIAGLSLRFHVADNTFSGQEIKQLGNSFVFCECYQAPGCKESQFYSLPFGQAVAGMY